MNYCRLTPTRGALRNSCNIKSYTICYMFKVVFNVLCSRMMCHKQKKLRFADEADEVYAYQVVSCWRARILLLHAPLLLHCFTAALLRCSAALLLHTTPTEQEEWIRNQTESEGVNTNECWSSTAWNSRCSISRCSFPSHVCSVCCCRGSNLCFSCKQQLLGVGGKALLLWSYVVCSALRTATGCARVIHTALD